MTKAELEHGKYYRGRCRNADVARWDAEHNCFFHWRTKFGHKYVEAIYHPDDEPYYDVFTVECELIEAEQNIPFPTEEGYNGVITQHE